MRYWNPSKKEWQNDPYMVKEYTVLSPCNKWAATVVVCVKEGTKTKKNGETVDSTDFFTTGVRIEWLKGRVNREGYAIPGSAYFVGKKSGNITETGSWSFRTDRCGNMVKEGHLPVMVKPEKRDGASPFDFHPMVMLFTILVNEAWAAHERYMQEKRQAA